MPRIEHGEVLVPAEALQAGIERVARDLHQESKDRDPLNVGIMTGSFIFAAFLAMEMIKIDPALNPEFEFMRTGSYGQGTQAKEVRIIDPLPADTAVDGRHVNLVDDIYDSSNTMRAATKYVRGLGASGVTLVLLSAREPHPLTSTLNEFEGYENVNMHVAVTVPSDAFVIGMGLNGPKGGRVLPYIAAHD